MQIDSSFIFNSKPGFFNAAESLKTELFYNQQSYLTSAGMRQM